MKSFIELLQNDIEAELLNEERLPLVGVFWLIDGEIDGDVRDINSSEDTVVQTIDGKKIVSGKFNHFTIWNKIKPEKYKDKPYNFLPRGRVVSDETNYKFIVFANKILNTMEYRTKIKRYYNLLENDIIWNFDEPHYN